MSNLRHTKKKATPVVPFQASIVRDEQDPSCWVAQLLPESLGAHATVDDVNAGGASSASPPGSKATGSRQQTGRTQRAGEGAGGDQH